MKDLIERLKKEQYSCIIKQTDTIYTEKNHGIIPILNFLQEGKLKGAKLADKVIGKAAAMMMVYGGVQEVAALIISEHALSVFQAYGIPVTYEACVPYIVNRQKNGMCPMEETVLHIDNLEEAYTCLFEKTKQLQKMSM